MNTASNLKRCSLTGIIAVVGALLLLAGPAQAGAPRPAGWSKAQYRALTLRSEALNRMYRIGKYRRIDGLTAAQYRAVERRSEALDKTYGVGTGATRQAAPQVTPVAGGFAWSAFGIGAAAMAGFVLLTAGLIAGRPPGICSIHPRKEE